MYSLNWTFDCLVKISGLAVRIECEMHRTCWSENVKWVSKVLLFQKRF